MVTSSVKNYKGVPTLFINSAPVSAIAYITYSLDKYCYDDFAKIGYNLFSVPLFFSSQPINDSANTPPLNKGIYDNIYKGEKPDYTIIDEQMERVISACNDAYILIRVNLSLPFDWEEANPDELCQHGFNKHKRACFSSSKWQNETKKLLVDFINYVENSKYKDHVIGYQLSGGNTEEWFSFDRMGSVGKRSEEGFRNYCKMNNIEATENEYYRYLSDVVADSICQFAMTTKNTVKRKIIVGTFYGYTLECPQRSSCHLALNKVLESPYIDFICSPVSYYKYRDITYDCGCMLPVDSLKEHGKLYFAEADQRTHLTKPPFDIEAYKAKIWQPTIKEETLEIMKMEFARMFIHGYAMWWFDMWGGWYKDNDYLDLIKKCKIISDNAIHKAKNSASQVAMFVDEKSLTDLDEKDDRVYFGAEFRTVIGRAGASYDCYLADDWERVIDNYKLIIFVEPQRKEVMTAVRNYIKDKDINLLVIDKSNVKMSEKELMEIYNRAKVNLITDKPAVVYENKSYTFIHTSVDGVYNVKNSQSKLRDLFTDRIYNFPCELKKGQSLLFANDDK